MRYSVSQRMGKGTSKNRLEHLTFVYLDWGLVLPIDFPVREALCPVRVVSCAIANRVKRLDRIVEVVGIVAAAYPSVQFKWSFTWRRNRLSDIVGIARDRFSNVPNLRHQFPGQLSNTQVMEFYENNFVDCFLNLSESEGLPVSMMEAMSLEFRLWLRT